MTPMRSWAVKQCWVNWLILCCRHSAFHISFRTQEVGSNFPYIVLFEQINYSYLFFAFFVWNRSSLRLSTCYLGNIFRSIICAFFIHLSSLCHLLFQIVSPIAFYWRRHYHHHSIQFIRHYHINRPFHHRQRLCRFSLSAISISADSITACAYALLLVCPLYLRAPLPSLLVPSRIYYTKSQL